VFCVMAALRREIDPFLDLLENVRRFRDGGAVFFQGELHHAPVLVVKTGIGRKEPNRERLSCCTLMISTGFCGALAPDLNAGDVVVARSILHLESSPCSTTSDSRSVRKWIEHPTAAAENPPGGSIPSLLDASRSLRDEGFEVRWGKTITSDAAVRTVEEKSSLHSATGALSVDMEDFYRLRVARSLNARFLSIRAVLDSAREELPRLAGAARLGGSIASLLRNAPIAQKAITASVRRIISP
jgi:nucleoside phosphorylase